MAKQTLTAMFDNREAANSAVLVLRRYLNPEGDVSISPEAAATGYSETMPAHVREFWAQLDTMFGHGDDRHRFAEAVRRGGIMVVTHVNAADIDGAAAVLERHGAFDLIRRGSVCRAEDQHGGPVDTDRAIDGPHSVAPAPPTEVARAAAGVLATPSAETMYRATAISTEVSPAGPEKGVSGGGGTGRSNAVRASVQHAKGLEVIGCDGKHVGVIDHVEGVTITLQHPEPTLIGTCPLIPVSWVHSIDDKVMLKITAADARSRWSVS